MDYFQSPGMMDTTTTPISLASAQGIQQFEDGAADDITMMDTTTTPISLASARGIQQFEDGAADDITPMTQPGTTSNPSVTEEDTAAAMAAAMARYEAGIGVADNTADLNKIKKAQKIQQAKINQQNQQLLDETQKIDTTPISTPTSAAIVVGEEPSESLSGPSEPSYMLPLTIIGVFMILLILGMVWWWWRRRGAS